MNDDMPDDIAIEGVVKEVFGLQLEVKQVVVRGMPLSRTARGTLFLTNKQQLYFLVMGKANLTVSDVTKMTKKAGLLVAETLPPGHDKDYFKDLATARYREVYPGLVPHSEVDLMYYKSLVPYNPALLLIAATTDGVIRQFDPEDTSDWRVATKFTYKRIM